MPTTNDSADRPANSRRSRGAGGITVHPLLPAESAFLRGAAVDEATVELLESSFRILAAAGSRLGSEFYGRLFDCAPALRPLFPSNLEEQAQKLLQSLSSVIESLRSPDAVRDRLRDLGRRHVGYGARPEHYPLVCDCLLASMRVVAGDRWTERLQLEWRNALELIARIMLQGAAAPSGGDGSTGAPVGGSTGASLGQPHREPGPGGPPVRLDR